MSISSLHELNQRWWYRFIKVAYVLVTLLVLASALIIIFDEGRDSFSSDMGWALLAIIIAFSITQLVKRTFYYIVLGTFNPPH